MPSQYLFTSQRLGFRAWTQDDIPHMAAINDDPVVMEFFPATQTMQQTKAFTERMQLQLAEKGYCYYAVDTLDTGAFIGFIGLSLQTFGADFTPCVDIGWRLSKSHWNKGYATEGAARCLHHAFHQLHLPVVYAMAPAVNIRSLRVMQKLGMQLVGQFIHPLLLDSEYLKDCLRYQIVPNLL